MLETYRRGRLHGYRTLLENIKKEDIVYILECVRSSSGHKDKDLKDWLKELIRVKDYIEGLDNEETQSYKCQ